MAADNLPAITLTDPNNHDAAPSPAMSPAKDAVPPDLGALSRSTTARPVTPTGRGGASMQAMAKTLGFND